ncbi:MAG TPA: tetratricopeptide repeat protein, partial [Candidatus Limnocylindria bacterium]|nr:tetratricopeptide repeat protein [Candidatus Limnocylindria bacterium]
MAYQIIPNIIFIFSVLGILLIILKHLPEAAKTQDVQPGQQDPELRLIQKGLPAQAISRAKVVATETTQKVWNFILEAKDLKPQATTGYKIKKIFSAKMPVLSKPGTSAPHTLHEIKNEQYLLDSIKAQPKNLNNYDLLGKFYLEKENVTDAKDIFLYLVNHQPANPEFQARLGYCYYQTKNYVQAAEAYRKSLALDSTQPNRYYNLSLSLQALGKKTDATQALKKALELEPQNPKFLQALEKVSH